MVYLAFPPLMHKQTKDYWCIYTLFVCRLARLLLRLCLIVVLVEFVTSPQSSFLSFTMLCILPRNKKNPRHRFDHVG